MYLVGSQIFPGLLALNPGAGSPVFEAGSKFTVYEIAATWYARMTLDQISLTKIGENTFDLGS